jgi:hypothetical protein
MIFPGREWVNGYKRGDIGLIDRPLFPTAENGGIKTKKKGNEKKE